MKEFTYFWLTGEKEVLRGNDVADALNKAGYGQGALRALDFWAHGNSHDYQWNKISQKWDMTEEAKKRIFKTSRP